MDKKLLGEGAKGQLYLGGVNDRTDFNSSGASVRNKLLRYRHWYICYVVTALLVFMSTVLLFVFGVSDSGDSLIQELGGQDIADKILDSIVDIMFKDFSIGIDQGGELIDPDYPYGDNLNGGDEGQNNNSPDIPQNSDEEKKDNDIYDFDYSLVPEGHTPIIPMDLSLLVYGNNYINNSTGYTFNAEQVGNMSIFENSNSIIYTPEQPRVLVLHTHGTEAYSEDNSISCESVEEHGRSNDKQENVVAIGKIISDTLNQQGIWTVHCTVMHDSTQYKDSYARAADTIKKYLEIYPSIEVVIDVHRDAIIKSSGEVVKTLTEIEGRRAAQIMCVVGSEFGGEKCPNWENNLSLALKLRNQMNHDYGNICRPVALKSSTYNQEFSKYSLLLEVGSSGNSFEEAAVSAELVAKAIAELLK